MTTLRQAARGDLPPLFILIEKLVSAAAEAAVESARTRAAEARKRAIAHVTVARPLSDDQSQRLRGALSRQVGRDVTLQVVVDPAVMGGVRVQVGDEVIDGTVSHRLAAAERQLN